jgi:tRNA pseudouridine55 synthase
MSGPEGVVVIDKPSGCTSFDVVRDLRRASRQKRIGHCGTLDPMATGVLVVCLGWSTRLVPWLTSDRKTYEAEIQFGVTTDTDDAEGALLQRAEVPQWSEDEIERVLDGFRGTIEQVPPRYSAIHVDGKRAHALARAGDAFELAPRTVVVHALTTVHRTADRLTLTLDVSKGTYIRSIARDLGMRLGCGAHLVRLRRTRSGVFGVDAATPHDQAREPFPFERLLSRWDALAGMPALAVDEPELRRMRFGQTVPVAPENPPGTYRVASAPGVLLAVVRVERDDEGGAWARPERLVPEDGSR